MRVYNALATVPRWKRTIITTSAPLYSLLHQTITIPTQKHNNIIFDVYKLLCDYPFRRVCRVFRSSCSCDNVPVCIIIYWIIRFTITIMSVGEYCSYKSKIMQILFVYISILHRMHTYFFSDMCCH